MEISITEASKAWGLPRSSIYNKIKSGKLSKMPNGKLDIAEVVRVFGEPKKHLDASKNVQLYKVGHSENVQNDAILLEKIQLLEQSLRGYQERERQAIEREDWLKSQVENLASTLKLLETPKKREKKSFFSRFFG